MKMKEFLSPFFQAFERVLFGPNRVREVLERNGNNFDLLRAFAASLVIVGHAFALAPAEGAMDPILRWIHFDYSGGLAVGIFFFLSGMLVCESFNRSNSLPVFFLARLARILPGLLVCLLFCIYIVGPLFSTLPLIDYFKSREVYSYFTKNALLTEMQWRLPGVFEASRFGLNGAMWSLPLEVRLYLVVGLIGVFGLLKGPVRVTLAIASIVAVAIYKTAWIPYFLNNSDFLRPTLSFVLGVWLAANKNWVRVNFFGVLLLVLACMMLWNTDYKQWLFYPAVYYSCLWFFSTPLCRRIKLPGDYSYGIYIYGFVVQQCVAALVFAHSPYGNLIVSLLGSVVLAALSWHFVEHPVLEAWRDFSGRVRKEPRKFFIGLLGLRKPVLGGVVAVAFMIPLFGVSAIDMASTEYELLPVKILSYGPLDTGVRQPFNVQPSGHSVLWINTDTQLGSEAVIIMGGVRLNGEVHGKDIVGEVPMRLLDAPKSLQICIQDRNSQGRLGRSASVLFKVQ